MIPFSLVWAGFAVFWEVSVLQLGAPAFMALGGIPFLLVGLYMIVGRFFIDAYQRRHTYYGLTDQRAIIQSPSGVKSISLRGLADLAMKERSDRSGTILFGSGDPRYAMFAGTGWPGSGRYLPPCFEMIEDVRGVHTQIREAQRAAG